MGFGLQSLLNGFVLLTASAQSRGGSGSWGRLQLRALVELLKPLTELALA